MSKCFSNFRKSYVAHYQNKHKIQGHTCKICKAQFAEYTELMTVSTSTYPLRGNQVLANFKATLPCFESVPFVFCASCGSDPLMISWNWRKVCSLCSYFKKQYEQDEQTYLWFQEIICGSLPENPQNRRPHLQDMQGKLCYLHRAWECKYMPT